MSPRKVLPRWPRRPATRADEVDSVVSFYSMYHREPESTYVIKVCTSISCYLMGCDDLLAHLEDRLGIRKGEIHPRWPLYAPGRGMPGRLRHGACAPGE